MLSWPFQPVTVWRPEQLYVTNGTLLARLWLPLSQVSGTYQEDVRFDQCVHALWSSVRIPES